MECDFHFDVLCAMETFVLLGECDKPQRFQLFDVDCKHVGDMISCGSMGQRSSPAVVLTHAMLEE